MSVLLLERGEVINTWVSKVPLLSSDYRPSSAPAYKWTSVVPLAALTSATLEMVSGKAMGGSSKINAHLYCRSMPAEYDAWAQAGRKGWSWDEVLPYFIKSENSLTHGSRPWRGDKGQYARSWLFE